MKWLGILIIIASGSCRQKGGQQPVPTVDTLTTIAPLPNKVLTDTDNHSIKGPSEIALDSPNGPNIRDTNYKH